jgi:biopolymer transport protein ExbD
VKRSRSTEVELPITPMLDMAFQLLTFFILTYHPAPTEGQFAMSLLPAAPALDLNAPVPTEAPTGPADLPAAVRTVRTTLRAAPSGDLASIRIDENEPMADIEALRSRAKAIFGNKELPFDQVLIEVDPRLKYSELMRVIDVYASLDVTKISFAELADRGGGPEL